MVTKKLLLMVLLLFAPAGAGAANSFIRITIRSNISFTGDFINRVVFLTGQNSLHKNFALDFDGQTPKPTEVIRVATPPTTTRVVPEGLSAIVASFKVDDVYLDLAVPEGAEAVALLTDGHIDDYKKKKKTHMFWGGSRLDSLLRVKASSLTAAQQGADEYYLFEVKESDRKSISTENEEDKYIAPLLQAMDTWINQHGPSRSPDEGGTRIKKLRIFGEKTYRVIFSNHVVTENENGYPLPTGPHATVQDANATGIKVQGDPAIEYTIPEGATTAMLLNVAEVPVKCFGILSLSEVSVNSGAVRGGWKAFYDEFDYNTFIAFYPEVKGDASEPGFYNPETMPWLQALIGQE